MPSVAEHKPLLMRANRVLGAQLVELNLVKIQDIEQANEKLLELTAKAQWRQSSVLAILAYDMKVIREDDLLQHVTEADGVGLVDLRDYEVPDESRKHLDLGACWATWSVPFDREEEFYFVATAYYLSSAARAFWEKQLGGPILWFGTTLENVADYLEKLQTERTASLTPFGSRPPVPGGAAVPGGTPRIFPAPAKT